MEAKDEPIRLTQYSHGSGCGCKIAPADLERILANARTDQQDPRVLIGNGTSDDAAVIDLGDGRALISTTDFFMPIVDDAYDFGRVAATNAISDVYAMGGEPLTAIAILGWPLEQLGADLAGRVLKGAKATCQEAGISLSGGHSIESKEPFFGLSVNGLVQKNHITSNAGAQPGDLLYLTKPIGTGILATALKRGLLDEGDTQVLTQTMSKLNAVGTSLGKVARVNALTDVTGFGVVGHLIEMCTAANCSAEINPVSVPLLIPERLNALISQFVMPDNTMRNFKAYSAQCSKMDARQLQLLCDPQTSGGLLISVSLEAKEEVENLLQEHNAFYPPIGKIIAASEPRIQIITA